MQFLYADLIIQARVKYNTRSNPKLNNDDNQTDSTQREMQDPKMQRQSILQQTFTC